MFININSSSRASGEDSDFWIELSGTLPPSLSKIRLHSVQFYRSFYNITSSSSTNDATPNNMLSFSVGVDIGSAVDLTCSIPEGDYDISALVAALQSAMNAALVTATIPATVTITINTLTNKLVFEIDSGYSLKINNIFGLQTTYRNIGLNLLIGFPRRSDSTFAASITGTRSFNTNRYLNLVLETNIIATNSSSYTTSGSPFITASNITSTEQIRILGVVPINAGSNELITYLNNDTAWQNLARLASSSRFLFRFRTTDNDRISFQGQLVNIVLEVL